MVDRRQAATVHVDDAVTLPAPDGSMVHLLLTVEEGGMAVFELPAGRTSRPVRHPRVQELWYVVSGAGSMWRRPRGDSGDVVDLRPGSCVSIRRGTAFQFRSTGTEPLRVVGATMPPWSGDEDAEVLGEDGGHWPVDV